MNMNDVIGKRFRVKDGEYISKDKYEVVALDHGGYIIGFNFNKEDSFLIKGWPQEDGKYGNKYKLFWFIGKNNLIKENNSLNIE